MLPSQNLTLPYNNTAQHFGGRRRLLNMAPVQTQEIEASHQRLHAAQTVMQGVSWCFSKSVIEYGSFYSESALVI